MMTQQGKDHAKARRQMWLWVALALGTVGVILAGLLTQTRQSSAPTDPASVAPRAQVGYRAPDFTLRDLTGAPTHLAELRGHPVILNFWYADCAGCQMEAAFVERLYQDHEQQGLIVLGVNIADGQAVAQQYAKRFGVTYPCALDSDQRVRALYQVNAAPVSFFIDRQGVIRAIVMGVLDGEDSANGLREIGIA